jgi:hypothetical protein
MTQIAASDLTGFGRGYTSIPRVLAPVARKIPRVLHHRMREVFPLERAVTIAGSSDCTVLPT